MKYDEKYPSTPYGVQPYPGVIKMAGNPLPCWNCREPTEWWDIEWSVPLCSEECLKAKDEILK
jgi:hypothetical protein